MQTELLYELYESCMRALLDTERAIELSKELHDRACRYAERLDMLLTDSIREQLSDDITARMDILIRRLVK